MKGKSAALVLGMSLGFMFVGSSAVDAAERPQRPVREDEKVCWNMIGTQDTRDCLAKARSLARDSVERWLSLFHEKFQDDPQVITALDESQKKWEEDIEKTCGTLVWQRHHKGSLRYTKPVRCQLGMIKERGLYLRILARMTFSADQSVSSSSLRQEQKICWNPFGLAEELDCLQDALAEARADLKAVIGRIYGSGGSAPESELKKLFHEAHEKWRQNVQYTSDRLVRILFENTSLKDSASLWFKVLMTKERTHFLRVEYHRTLYP